MSMILGYHSCHVHHIVHLEALPSELFQKIIKTCKDSVSIDDIFIVTFLYFVPCSLREETLRQLGDYELQHSFFH